MVIRRNVLLKESHQDGQGISKVYNCSYYKIISTRRLNPEVIILYFLEILNFEATPSLKDR